MRSGLGRCSFTTSLLLLALLTPAAAAECPAYRDDVAPMQLDRLLADAGVPYGSPNDDKNINNAGMNEEGIESVIRLSLWRGERSSTALPAVRFTAATEPTHLELPEAVLVTPIERWSCLIAAGDQAYLSDGITDHSSQVYAVDRAAQLVTFIDARAAEVFLLSANALFDDFGGVAFEREGRSFFTVPFASVDKLLKQLVPAPTYDPVESRATLAAILPELSGTELAYWRDQSVFATVDYNRIPESLIDFAAPQTGEVLQQVLVNYVFLQGDLANRLSGQTAALPDGFGPLLLELPGRVSANMSFRFAVDLLDAGEPELANALAAQYLERRGPDIDFSLVQLLAARQLGDTVAAEQFTAAIRTELDARLAKMYRGATPEQNRDMLAARIYENTTILLMRQRYAVLERNR